MHVENVTLPSSDGLLRGIIARPDGDGPWPAVVMVHEVFGIDVNMRAHAERLAAMGYLAVMPDLYSRGGARKCLTSTFRALRDGRGQAFDDVETTRNWLLARPDCTGRVGVIGFCLGGAFALQLAPRGYDASAVNYGQLPNSLDDALRGACPIVGSFGADDPSLKGAAATLTAALERNAIPHDVKEYPGASHAFLNPGPAGPRLFSFIAQRVGGFGPRPEQAEDAWRRIDAFFAEHLGAPTLR
ncbi:MAG TPA: dienelactone hydrolase family protein [Microbacteriaceae bacterium]|nr:dienelactone hydrolase family protein [Microbacteriaceae bacterium]